MKKKMKKRERELLMLLIIVVVLIIAISLIISTIKKNKQNQVAEGEQNNQVVEEFVEVLEDGTKLNNSAKLTETKKVGELEISNLKLTESRSQTQLLGVIKNNTEKTEGGYSATVKILDKEGNEIVELGAYINEVAPGEEAEFNVSATLDYANAYDVIIEKK